MITATAKVERSQLFVVFSLHMHFPVLSQHNLSLVRKKITFLQFVLRVKRNSDLHHARSASRSVRLGNDYFLFHNSSNVSIFYIF